MKTQLHLSKITILLTALLFGISFASIAGTFTALTSGNWSNATTWGGNGPGFNLTGNDNVVIPTGLTVSLDNSLIINNTAALVTVAGSLTGLTNMTLTAGTLSGAGLVSLNSITIGSAGFVTMAGTISINQFINNQPSLPLTATLNITDTFTLNAGIVRLNTGSAVTLTNNAIINMAGGSFNINGGSLLSAGNYNLFYTGSGLKAGAEISLTGLQNVTVDLTSPSSQLELTGNLAIAGLLTLQQGVLSLNGKDLTINGDINTSAAGSVLGNISSNITINGTGDTGMIAFAAVNQSLNNLTLNIAAGGSLSLVSDVTLNGVLALNAGSLNLNGYNLTVNGIVSNEGTGSIIGNSSSTIAINGSGNAGTLILNPSNNTLASLTININSAGSIALGSDIVLSGIPALTLSGGSLNLNGYNLTVGGAVLTSGNGSIGGNANSNLTFNGSGGSGLIAFSSGNGIINNLTMDIAFSGAVSLTTGLSIGGTLNLIRGEIGIGDNDLTITGSGNIQGGSASAYVITNGTGSLIMPLANAGSAGLFPVGTQENYAPVILTNNSATAGNFGVFAHQGIFANGTSGADLSIHQPVVNTSWDVSSSLTSGANVTLEMFWNTNMEVNGFDNTQAYISHYTGGLWDTSAFAAATILNNNAFSMMLTSVTSFSQFAVFNKSVTTTTAIGDLTATLSAGIYPNPATDQINISVQDPGNFLTMKIYDALGNLISSQAIVNALTVLNISNLTPGVYFASFNDTDTKKFIKE